MPCKMLGTSLHTCISKRLHCSYRHCAPTKFEVVLYLAITVRDKLLSIFTAWYTLDIQKIVLYCTLIIHIKCSKYCTIVQENRHIYNFSCTFLLPLQYICLCTYIPPPPQLSIYYQDFLLVPAASQWDTYPPFFPANRKTLRQLRLSTIRSLCVRHI